MEPYQGWSSTSILDLNISSFTNLNSGLASFGRSFYMLYKLVLKKLRRFALWHGAWLLAEDLVLVSWKLLSFRLVMEIAFIPIFKLYN